MLISILSLVGPLGPNISKKKEFHREGRGGVVVILLGQQCRDLGSINICFIIILSNSLLQFDPFGAKIFKERLATLQCPHIKKDSRRNRSLDCRFVDSHVLFDFGNGMIRC